MRTIGVDKDVSMIGCVVFTMDRDTDIVFCSKKHFLAHVDSFFGKLAQAGHRSGLRTRYNKLTTSTANKGTRQAVLFR